MKKIEDKQNNEMKKYLRLFWKAFAGTVLAILLFFLLASWGLFGAMPSFDELENPSSSVATEIISADGKTIGKFYLENRVAKYNSNLNSRGESSISLSSLNNLN